MICIYAGHDVMYSRKIGEGIPQQRDTLFERFGRKDGVNER